MGINARKKGEKGQILLIVVLAAVISLTVGLSAVSRTITNTRVTTDEADSQKALSAAEAGVEQLIGTSQSSLNQTFNNNSQVNATTIVVTGEQILLNGGNPIEQDDGTDIWLSTYPTYANQWSGNLKIYWTDNSATDCTQNAAVEIVLLSGPAASPAMTRSVYDPCDSRNSVNGFSDTQVDEGTSFLGETFNHNVTLSVSSGLLVRVVPLYANTTMGVRGYNSSNLPLTLPAQGTIIESTGVAGNASRKVRVYQGYPKVPTEYFPFSLFVPSP